MSAPVHVVAMGVSATGKTVVGSELAERLGYEFVEGDSLHPPQNIAKMESGVPLTDDDRWPWLRLCGEAMVERHGRGVSTVLTCSALRRPYRDLLRSTVGSEVFFVHLHASFQVLEGRMAHRTKHFMPTSLLRSQFDTLEPLQPDEIGAQVDVSPPLDEVVTAAESAVRERYPDG